MKSIDSNCEIEFVHGVSDLEKSIYSQTSFKCHFLSVGRLRKNVGKERWKTFFSLPFVLLKALILIMRIKPSLILGTGGAVSGPVLLAGFLLCKKTIIFEPNVVPGLTNRWLSYFVSDIIVVFNSTKAFFKTKKQVQFPFPVRFEINNIALKDKISSPLRVLVLGGSQGSFIINKAVSEFITSHKNSSFSFVHQTGKKGYRYLKNLYSDFKSVKIFSFLHKIHEFYEWADVVIGRAGTGTISELSAAGRAGILVPLASAADEHQLKNAQELEKKSAVIIIKENEFTVKSLTNVLEDLVNQPQKIKQISSKMYSLKLGAGADNIALYLLKK